MDYEVINNIKSLAIDMINEAKSGHPGIVLSAAPILYAIYANHLNINISDRKWYNRDRFIMSPGHGSALLYAILFMSGYNLTIDDLKKFRQLNSKTPGHPELNVTPGVECTTGALGQGFATAVGIALAEKINSNKYKCPDGKSLFNFKTYVLVSDGDLMEGISYEAASFAGAYNLNNLIVIYDSNSITLDGKLDNTFKENVRKRFKSMGFRTFLVKDGNNLKMLNFIINLAKRSNKPVFIEVKTKLGNGSLLENSNLVHGTPLTKDDIDQLKIKLKIPSEPFYLNEKAKNYLQQKIANRVNQKYKESVEIYKNYVDKVLNGNKTRISYLFNNNIPSNIVEFNWQFKEKESLRDINKYVLETIGNNIPIVIGGSADLGSSTKTYLQELGDISSKTVSGKNIWFGVREHCMGAILNGLALSNFRPFGSTFLAFADYLKPSLRMSALMKLPVIYIFTHDSVNIGCDGPTHQPVEQLAMLRSTPNLNVLRPADGKELVGCYQIALNSSYPSAIIISRNEVNLLQNTNSYNTLKGAYVVYPEQDVLKGIIVATGSEVQLVINIVKNLSNNIRVVSMPCREIFEKQDIDYRNQILPTNIKKVVVEAGSRYGLNGIASSSDCLITIDNFGKSGNKDDVLTDLNFNYEQIMQKIKNIFYI